MAIAAVFGGLSAAFMTGFLTPYWCFGIYSIFGFAVFASAFSIKADIENESDIELMLTMESGIRRNCWQEFVHNMKIVKQEFKLPLFQHTILFFFLMGITRPTFSDYLYFFKLDVAHLSQF